MSLKTCLGSNQKRQVNVNIVFGQGGGVKLAEELRTELLGQIPLGQPDWNETDFHRLFMQMTIQSAKFTRVLQKTLLTKQRNKNGKSGEGYLPPPLSPPPSSYCHPLLSAEDCPLPPCLLSPPPLSTGFHFTGFQNKFLPFRFAKEGY